jgi:hypothetical protein
MADMNHFKATLSVTIHNMNSLKNNAFSLVFRLKLFECLASRLKEDLQRRYFFSAVFC